MTDLLTSEIPMIRGVGTRFPNVEGGEEQVPGYRRPHPEDMVRLGLGHAGVGANERCQALVQFTISRYSE